MIYIYTYMLYDADRIQLDTETQYCKIGQNKNRLTLEFTSRSMVDPLRSYFLWIFMWALNTFLITTMYVSMFSTVNL